VNKKHSKACEDSLADPAKFWDAEAKKLWWHKPYEQIIDTSD